MADAKAHKLGQLIGEFIEKNFEKQLTEICHTRGLYLDVVGKTRPARGGKKVKWEDIYGASHDLDFVIERNGTDQKLGIPAALIECAWRRYTKHSKNKAQEIQGAVLPIAEKYNKYKPFLAAVLAGFFTQPSIQQLESSGFIVLYFEYDIIIDAFKEVGVDLSFGEDTPDNDAQSKIDCFLSLSEEQLLSAFDIIISNSKEKIDTFKNSLINALDRQIISIVVSPMYGYTDTFNCIEDAINFLSNIDLTSQDRPLQFKQIFVQIQYSNDDKVSGTFSSTSNAVSFLNSVLNSN